LLSLQDGGGDAPVRFRNYLPADESLKQNVVASSVMKKAPGSSTKKTAGAEQPPPQSAEGEDAAAPPNKKEEEEEDAIQRELRKHMEENGGDQLLVAPRKPNWDLKRDVAKKMQKLDKLTKKAIVEILREKLASQEGEDDDEEEDEE